MPLFVLPLGLSFIVLFSNLNKNVQNKVLRLIIFLWTFSIGLISEILWRFVEYPWKRIDESQAPTADAIIVLSNDGRHLAPGSSKIFEWKDPDRFISGIKLFREQKAPKLIFTGGASPSKKVIKTEGDLYRKDAISLGVPSEAIVTTNRVFNTAQEALAIKQYFESNPSSQQILLVTSAFHMQRAKKVFERQGFIVYPFPVDFKTSTNLSWKDPYNWIPNSHSLSMSSKAIREIIGRIIYKSW